MTKDKSILIKNVYYMLSYAFQTLKQSTYEHIAVEPFEEMHNLFAAILSNGIGLQLKHGLYHEYIDKSQALSTMRGKINIPATLRNHAARQRVLSCNFDELSENNLFNKILKTTLLLLLSNSKVKTPYKDDLKKKLLFFSNIDIVNLWQINWSSLHFQRNNQTYRMLVGICQLIAEGLLLTTDKGDYKLATFLDEQCMCHLYEKFILEYYRQHYHKELSVSASQIPWALDDNFAPFLPVMQSDIHLQRGNNVLIIDAKYYAHTTQVQYNKPTIHSQNLYQIFTYVKNRHYAFQEITHNVSGMLLYARTDEEFQPDYVYKMHGNSIIVKTLDLSLDFSQITKQLDTIINEHFGPLTKRSF